MTSITFQKSEYGWRWAGRGSYQIKQDGNGAVRYGRIRFGSKLSLQLAPKSRWQYARLLRHDETEIVVQPIKKAEYDELLVKGSSNVLR